MLHKFLVNKGPWSKPMQSCSQLSRSFPLPTLWVAWQNLGPIQITQTGQKRPKNGLGAISKTDLHQSCNISILFEHPIWRKIFFNAFLVTTSSLQIRYELVVKFWIKLPSNSYLKWEKVKIRSDLKLITISLQTYTKTNSLQTKNCGLKICPHGLNVWEKGKLDFYQGRFENSLSLL
jgi:hypothetical protein